LVIGFMAGMTGTLGVTSTPVTLPCPANPG
jgi:hypothetical protein